MNSFHVALEKGAFTPSENAAFTNSSKSQGSDEKKQGTENTVRRGCSPADKWGNHSSSTRDKTLASRVDTMQVFCYV